MNTMKALVKKQAEEGIWLEDVPIPEIGNNDVLVKIKKTAICGTDVHIYNWDDSFVRHPGWPYYTSIPKTSPSDWYGAVTILHSSSAWYPDSSPINICIPDEW